MNESHTAASTHQRTRDLTAAALVTALLAASAWVVIPAGAVPVTLQLFFVVLAALLLRPGWAAAAIALYIAMGALGLPVFAGGKAGFGVLLGPTGGYLLGFLAGATIGSAARTVLRRGGTRPVVADFAAAAAVVVVVYGLGATQLAFQLLYGPGQALAFGVLPFVLPDVGKAAAAVVVAQAVRRAARR